MTKKILIIEDEEHLRRNLRFIFESENYEVTDVDDGKVALSLLSNMAFDLVLCDIRIPSMDGLRLLKEKKIFQGHPSFIMMTAYGTIESAIDAIKLGADEYVTKPFRNQDIIRLANRLAQLQTLTTENIEFKRAIQEKYELNKKIIGASDVMQKVFKTVDKIAKVNTTVLITGENGTGKELIARGIHSYSERGRKPFIPVNCAAIPENLFESELFGHEKGVFTGAINRKKGLFEEAEGGTLFLDEISEIPIHLQVKLLRVLQEQKIRRVGGNEIIPINVRILSASNRNLEKLIEDNLFRQDLFYRIRVVEVHLPPLRERGNDFHLLTEFFLKKYAKAFKRPVPEIPLETYHFLKSYHWPGNVRELEHLIQSALVLSEGDILRVEDFNAIIARETNHVKVSIPMNTLDLKQVLSDAKRTIEIDMIKRALERSNDNKTKAAKLLGISHRNMLYKIQAYNLN